MNCRHAISCRIDLLSDLLRHGRCYTINGVFPRHILDTKQSRYKNTFSIQHTVSVQKRILDTIVQQSYSKMFGFFRNSLSVGLDFSARASFPHTQRELQMIKMKLFGKLSVKMNKHCAPLKMAIRELSLGALGLHCGISLSLFSNLSGPFRKRFQNSLPPCVRGAKHSIMIF